jgi:site-specific DNA-cytosine methylase
MNGINKIEIPQLVKVRKYPVNIEKLKQVLRDAKIETDLTNSRIAFELDVPLTTVEHWFRKDNSFSIPDEEIWHKLKNLLCITTCEFDESIMTFEEKEGVYEKSNRYYLDDGISPTITSASANEKIITSATVQKDSMVTNNLRIRKLTPKECWRLMGFDDEDFEKAEKVNSNTQLYKQARKFNLCTCTRKNFKTTILILLIYIVR